MAFSGNLEDLSIVDVIQLIHTTRKTGTLKVEGRKGDISIAFNDGFMVGASHYQQGARIGKILVEAGVITEEARNKALKIQAEAGDNRKPLIATLLENGLADSNAAYLALETLIELSIVEILTWKKGFFTLQVDEILVCDEFRYFPENLNNQMALPTEHLLMDALRIFDEKMRDGLLNMEEDAAEEAIASATPPEHIETPASSTIFLSAEDLGLDNLDDLKPKLPVFHEALNDHPFSGTIQAAEFNEIIKKSTARLQKTVNLPETSLVFLETVAKFFQRAITFVVWENELVAERSIGIKSNREAGVSPVMGFRIPRSKGKIFNSVIENGLLFYGRTEDELLQRELYPAIGAPKDSTVLLLPLKLGKRVVAIVYADFGEQTANEIQITRLEHFAEYASIVIESTMIKKQLAAENS